MKKYKMILFDLDGTLLPMDQDVFVRNYFGRLAVKLAPMGYDPKALVNHIWAGVGAMVKNDGSCTNEDAFWKEFSAIYGPQVMEHIPVFDEFYRNEFQLSQEACGFNPKAKETVHGLKEMGYRVALATNPIFPSVATESRIRWAGLEPEDFEFFTTYENSSSSKPNPLYYAEVLNKLGCEAKDCLMVGNDVTEDGAAMKIGLNVFFLTDCLINQEQKDISAFPHGSFDDLLAFLREEN